jgi:hypothetical protein
MPVIDNREIQIGISASNFSSHRLLSDGVWKGSNFSRTLTCIVEDAADT